ncbi:MAG TPA: MarR family transcriptional regulator [Pseudobacteroides sp.]|uniref:MarR family winged helix-turn-helix transcriptional regulator n=1 Tax=Pseudobacteroides sp. TaxID=1968840 RepID=UPI002F9254B9
MERGKLVDNFLVFFPFVYKKLMRDMPVSDISRQKLGLLQLISSNDCNTMSYYSNKTMISKPNLTVMADKLIEENLIERMYDPNDRRVINLKITEKGKNVLEKHKIKVKETLLKKFEMLGDDEVKRLNELINEMESIMKNITRE